MREGGRGNSHVAYIPQALNNQPHELLPIHIRIRKEFPARKRYLRHTLTVLADSILDRAWGRIGGRSGTVRQSARETVGSRAGPIRMTIAAERIRSLYGSGRASERVRGCCEGGGGGRCLIRLKSHGTKRFGRERV